MEARDLAPVAGLSAELGYPVETRELAARWENLAASGEDAVFVAELSGDVAGWVHVGPARALTHPPGSEIKGLVVRRDSRRRGIGRLLLRAAEEWSRARGDATVRLRTRTTREEAHRFYEACGYAPKKTQHVFVKELR